jgi:hypothetical protein
MSESLAANALTTIDAVRALLDVAEYGPERDRIIRAINAASAEIEHFCGREFGLAEDVVEYIPGHGGLHITVRRPPIQSITSISYNGSALTADVDYVVQYATAGVIRLIPCAACNDYTAVGGLTFDTISGTGLATASSGYTVTYDGGYVLPRDATISTPRTLPYDLEAACISVALGLYHAQKTDPHVMAYSIMGYSETRGGGAYGFPASVIPTLRRYQMTGL